MKIVLNDIMKKSFYLIFMVLIIESCKKDDDIPDLPYNPAKDQIVKSRNEIRAAWIATVSNLDWPSAKSNPDAQMAEMTNMLEQCKSFNFNAVIFQIRPTADAFYPSALEPWASYLTGTQGTDPGYDPLKFAIDEAHKRGMELHAWLNPYRIGATSLALAPGHAALKNPDWVVTFNGVRYFNPGVPGAVEHLKNVVRDIITRYDVDAIHFDDYFYPSGAKNTANPFVFDDKAAWEKYGAGKDIHNWRYENVSKMVSEIGQIVRTTKPGVLFGISPSGRRENSQELYADPLEWLKNKWVDYLAPQIYWEFGHATADFGTVANFWNTNANGVPIVIGIAAYKFKDPAYPAYGTTEQLARQIDFVRESSRLTGCFFFREKFLETSELKSFIKSQYPFKSVLPEMGVSSASAPAVPLISGDGKMINWPATANAVKYAVYFLERDENKSNIFNARCLQISSDTQYPVEKGKSYFVTAVNGDNTESAYSNIMTVK